MTRTIIPMSVSNRVKEKLARGEFALCLGVRLARTAEVGMLADACGFESFYIDMEHSAISLDAAAQICAAALPIGVTPLVRIAGKLFDDASRLLDAGALGIICPHVDTADEARAFVAACKFPPVGRRSVIGASPLQSYRPTPQGEINKQGNEQTLCVAMLETRKGIENADAIAAVPGVDVVLIGSNDLCTEMGIPGELRHPNLRAAYETAAAACKKHGKHLGVGGIRNDPEMMAELARLGGRFIIAGFDVNYLMAAARADAEAIRKAVMD